MKLASFTILLVLVVALAACGTFEIEVAVNQAPGGEGDRATASPSPAAMLPTTVTSPPTATPTSRPAVIPSIETPEPAPNPTELPTINAPGPTAPPSVDGQGTLSYAELHEPVLIDGESGWLLASALVDGEQQVVKLASEDARPLASYGPGQYLGLDHAGKLLYIDHGPGGIQVIDLLTDETIATFPSPAEAEVLAAPQIVKDGTALLTFRGQTVYRLNPATGEAVDSLNLEVDGSVCGDPMDEPPAVRRSFYDLTSQKLYLALVTYVCTPWVRQTLVAYDANTLEPLGSYETELNAEAVAFSGSLYGTTAARLAGHVAWAWNGSNVWYEEGTGSQEPLKGIVADWARQKLYEVVGDRLYVYDPFPRTQSTEVQLRDPFARGRLVGHDPHTDQLYFLVDGILYPIPVQDLLP